MTNMVNNLTTNVKDIIQIRDRTIDCSEDTNGEFKRTATDFHSQISDDGDFKPEKGRYVLYVSYACPWAHRCLITRALKGLEDVIDVVSVNPVWGVIDEKSGKKSWVFKDETVDGTTTTDRIFSSHALKDIYEIHNPDYEGRYTVPILFDKKTNLIVNNESSEIILMLNTAFNFISKNPDFSIRPSNVAVDDITKANDRMYQSFNNGVYRAGFAQAQEAHEAGVSDVWEYLSFAEELLSKQRFLCSNDTFTEADLRMWVTACRFDPVYHTHFKCSKYRIENDFPNVRDWMCDVFVNIFNDSARETFKENHIKDHYYKSHPLLNPFGLVPDTGIHILNNTTKAADLASQRARKFS